jgi:acetate kinase
LKGSLHTDELLTEVLRRDTGIRTERRLSHCFLLSVPTYAHPFILTDAAINIAPDLMAKRDICQNAIDIAHAMGNPEPKVAILAAVETVNPGMPATLDAAALCKMADRGQITGGVLDGPLAFDNAADEEAARSKGINSPVAGKADILVVPDLEAGNMLAKQLVVIDAAAVAAIEALTPYAPLHQPQALRIIRAMQGLRPELRQTASFDTAFHRTIPERNRRFALPRALHDQGLRRYGFHGLSYKSIAATLRREHPELAAGRVIAAHLGSGASLCAMANGVSRDTSMGFSTLDGVPMATRCGALDPGVLLHLLGPGGRSLAEVEDMLYHRSGLLGVSGISADSRALLASLLPEADEALDLFAFRVAGEVARLAVSIGGLDALVFTAGIGEHQPEIRARVAAHLGWLGLARNDALNLGNARTISASSSGVACLVIPTDEEHVLAAEAAEVLEFDRK